MNFKKNAKELMAYISDATCSFTTVCKTQEMLEKEGFEALELSGEWKLEKGGKYYINVYDSSLMAFRVGENYNDSGMLRIATAHTDSPSFYVKPKTEMTSSMGDYNKLNVEGYGGAILSTWMDRPLSIAFRVSLKSDDVFEPEVKIVDFKKPIVTIPNLAIHMNRDVNKGVELNKQVDMLPIAGIADKEEKDFLISYMAKHLDVEKKDILDYEGYVYNTEEGKLVGMDEEFILCPRLDNATSCLACVRGIISKEAGDGINFISIFDNEEIGSRTKQGADSQVMNYVIEKIYACLSQIPDTRTLYINKVFGGMMISLDVAHATHPNHPEKNDPTNVVKLNAGPVIKRSGAQRYATDAQAVGVIEQICQKNNVPYQKFAIRSDMLGGSTLGPISDSYLPMMTVDIGIPMLAMHSSMETMGVKDQLYIEKLVEGFFER